MTWTSATSVCMTVVGFIIGHRFTRIRRGARAASALGKKQGGPKAALLFPRRYSAPYTVRRLISRAM